ncbi:nucleotide sugar dehydrogenase [Prochlorococcus marinus str. MU1402]|uniref:nucleotide sugar dehydrogenase n=1 Tax=Prochlorococcus marinus TaxID=1219 RepID=UPI001AD9B62D|nr:nucleotide sugar dehydrogenase [Prochlorococcus marinus]MBO8232422.1 nucleotide sugar dehydrogenase [Prochlorococcus marinus XMU1402]MBW3057150.1 nucleotide sugar dehydrogenase [Prochlorococcus marinus str. MU1402]
MKDAKTFKVKNICCIGAGYVGGPTMAVIAKYCPDINVFVVDIDKQKISNWNNKDLNKLPVFEPNLDQIIEKCRDKNLFFSHEIEKYISIADIVFISVNTPTKVRGFGAGKASDLKWVEACARQVANFARNHTIVVEKSTLPVRTAEVIQNILEIAQRRTKENNEAPTFDVLSNPEFLSEGTAINDLKNPDRVLIGGNNNKAIKTLSAIYENWVSKDKILETNIWSSELAKLTSNAFLAQRISSINSISAICESTGADVREVSRAIGKDTRIGSKFLDSGPGFGGSCFKKDILNLVYIAKFYGLNEVADFWESVVNINTWHQSRISQLVIKNLFGTLAGKKIVILGFAFKANTNDTRESAAIQICKDLINEGANLIINDPKVSSNQITHDLEMEQLNTKLEENSFYNNNGLGSWSFSKNIDIEIFEDAYAVLVLTEWPQYSMINWKKIAKKMIQPGWIFDSRSILDSEEVKNAELNLWRVGDGS